MERRLDHHRTGLRRPDVDLGGWQYRPGLPGGVPDREEPVGRQHRLVRRYLLRVRHPGAPPAPGAHDRHHRRTCDASRVHRRRHKAAGGHSPGHLRFRRRAARRRGQHAARRHPCAAGAPARAAGAPAAAAGHRPAARPALRPPRQRSSGGHPAAACSVDGRDHRRHLRRRLDPGGPRGDQRPLRGVHVQRVRATRHAGAVLPARRGGGQAPLPAARAGPHPRGRRGQAAARRRLGVPRLVGAGVHHRRARRRRRRVPTRQPPHGLSDRHAAEQHQSRWAG